jgi:TPR repeat protein
LADMKAAEQRLLTLVVAGALGVSAQAQQNPGLSVQPSGRSLDEPDAPLVAQPVDLSRPQPQPPTVEPTAEEEAFFAPAMRGEAWAQTKLGKLYATTSGDEERARQGLALLRSAAEQNDAEAIYLLATMAATGAGVEQSDVEAFERMQRAADLGFADAQFALGTMHFEGRGTTQNETAAVEAFRRAADGGHREAMFAAGRILLSKTEPETRAEGLALMNRAIEHGHIEATLMLATAYGRGSLGMPKDEAKAESLLKPGAERGDADCQMTLASLYQFGDMFGARRDEAQMWLQRAADQGHPRAVEILGSGSEEMQRPAEPAGPTQE